MHLEKLLLESFTSNYFNAVLLPCAASLKLIEVGTDISITTSFIAALLSCSLGSNHFTGRLECPCELLVVWTLEMNFRN